MMGFFCDLWESKKKVTAIRHTKDGGYRKSGGGGGGFWDNAIIFIQ